MRHKHADVIIAWANGEDIEFSYQGSKWLDYSEECGMFNDNIDYRIKPKEDEWKPCASNKLRFVIRETGLGAARRQLQQMMVNQNAEYQWMDVPLEEEA